MAMTRFQKLATAALVALLMLMFVGAIVRVTGAGLGCPDWPRCWGGLVPPSSAEEIDFDRLPMEKFRKAAEKQGIAPESVTVESLKAEFNPRHAWTEYVNRLSATPVSLLTIATFIAAFWQRPKRPIVFWMAFASLMLVIANALVGALVVSTLLKPAVITLHLALAMLMLGTLTYCVWRGTDTPWRIRAEQASGLRWQRVSVIALLGVIVVEGVMGTQVRQMTDELLKLHTNAPREIWNAELEQSWIYVIHRSFSWLVLLVAGWAWGCSVRFRQGGAGWVERAAFGIVIAQMALGIVMSQIHIYSWVQVLHVGMAAILVTLVWLWLFAVWRGITAQSA